MGLIRFRAKIQTKENIFLNDVASSQSLLGKEESLTAWTDSISLKSLPEGYSSAICGFQEASEIGEKVLRRSTLQGGVKLAITDLHFQVNRQKIHSSDVVDNHITISAPVMIVNHLASDIDVALFAKSEKGPPDRMQLETWKRVDPPHNDYKTVARGGVWGAYGVVLSDRHVYLKIKVSGWSSTEPKKVFFTVPSYLL